MRRRPWYRPVAISWSLIANWANTSYLMGWAIIAAGNRDSDRAVTTRMPTPLRNRFVHLEFEVDVQEWSEWAIQTANSS